MKNSFRNVYFAALLLLIYLAGCAPTKQFDAERILSSDRLIKRLEANRRKVKEFRGTGVISIQSSEINAKSNFEVLIKKPDSVRVSFYGPFGIDLAQAVITPRDFQFYDVINNNLYRGRLKDGIMKQILKIDMSFDEILDALAGSVNLTDKLRAEPDKYETISDHYQLTYSDSISSINKIYLVRISDLAISKSLLNRFNGDKLLEGDYSRFKVIDDVAIPYDITLNDLPNKQKLAIEYRTIEVNKNNGNLKLVIPNDVKIIEW